VSAFDFTAGGAPATLALGGVGNGVCVAIKVSLRRNTSLRARNVVARVDPGVKQLLPCPVVEPALSEHTVRRQLIAVL
jgi:hypothetical protein